MRTSLERTQTCQRVPKHRVAFPPPDSKRSWVHSGRPSTQTISFKGNASFSLSPENKIVFLFLLFSFSTSVTPSQRQVDSWDLLASWFSQLASSKFSEAESGIEVYLRLASGPQHANRYMHKASVNDICVGF